MHRHLAFGASAEAARGSRSLEVQIPPLWLEGSFVTPEPGHGIVLFVHDSSGRLSPRNQFVAGGMQAVGLGTLLFDPLLREEVDDRRKVFDIRLLADRLVLATDWLSLQGQLANVPLGYFGASAGAAVALVAETMTPHPIAAIVSRGGRPDLAGPALADVEAPTLLIVGGLDADVIALNEEALAKLGCEKRLEIVPGAGHLFEETGTLDEVVKLARDWFAPRLIRETPQ
jgi:putative phosphoribosyl transferase